MNGHRFEHVQQVWTHRQGQLVIDQGAWATRFVIDGVRGVLVGPVAAAVMEAGEAALELPAVGDLPSASLHVGLRAADQSADQGWVDRFAAYHPAEKGHWCVMEVRAARLLDGVMDNAPLINPLAGVEGRVLRGLNADKAGLAAAAGRVLGSEVREALAIGVDLAGIDLRTSAGLRRLRATAPLRDEGAVRAWLGLLGSWAG